MRVIVSSELFSVCVYIVEVHVAWFVLCGLGLRAPACLL